MNITVEQITKQVEITPRKTRQGNRHQEIARLSQRKKYHRERVVKWREALSYALTQEGDMDTLAETMARRYNISKVKY